MAENSDKLKMVCLKCGTESDLGTSVCPNCGSDSHLLQAKQGVSEIPPAHKIPVLRGGRVTIIGIAAIIIAAMLIVLVNVVNKPPNSAGKAAGKILAAEKAIEKEESADNGKQPDNRAPADEENFDDLNATGSWHMSRGEWADAIASYEKALALKNDDIDVIRELTLAYLEMDDVDSALFHLNRWSRLKPDDPEPHGLKGSLFYGQGKLEEANAEYRTALKLTGKSDSNRDEYSEKIKDISKKLDEEKQKSEESGSPEDNGWIPVELPKAVSKAKQDLREQTKEKGVTPFSQFFKLDDNEKKDDSGTVLIGEGEGKKTDTGAKDNAKADDASKTTGDEKETVEKSSEPSATQPGQEPIEITGARFDASDNDFSIYIDTMGRTSPRYYYEKEMNFLWLTVPDAKCDFTVVPRERTFTHPFVDKIKIWPDEDGDVRIKISLKGPIEFSPPTVLGVGFSLHLRNDIPSEG